MVQFQSMCLGLVSLPSLPSVLAEVLIPLAFERPPEICRYVRMAKFLRIWGDLFGGDYLLVSIINSRQLFPITLVYIAGKFLLMIKRTATPRKKPIRTPKMTAMASQRSLNWLPSCSMKSASELETVLILHRTFLRAVKLV